MIRSIILVLVLFASNPATSADTLAHMLDTSSGSLSGSLIVPDTPQKPPVILFIAGSGPTDRDGNSTIGGERNDSLKLLAEALSAAGYATLRYDKRGVGKSTFAIHDESDLRIENYVQDAIGWISDLKRDSRFSRVVILGHSEGSLIGTLAAQRVSVSQFISIAGPSENAATVIRRQLQGRLPSELSLQSESILRLLEQGRTTRDVPPQLAALFRPSVQPYLISWFKYSPANEIRKLNTPCLLLQGTTDIQVTTGDAKTLHASRTACKLEIVNGMNHIMKQVPDDLYQQIASYGDPSLPISKGLVNSILSFLSSYQEQHKGTSE